MQVREIMNSNVVSIAPEESASLAARLLNRYNVGALPVCGTGQTLRGILTDRDIVMRCIAADGGSRAYACKRDHDTERGNRIAGR